jgi:hypothetical protein
VKSFDGLFFLPSKLGSAAIVNAMIGINASFFVGHRFCSSFKFGMEHRVDVDSGHWQGELPWLIH